MIKKFLPIFGAFLFTGAISLFCFYRSVPELYKWWNEDSCLKVEGTVEQIVFVKGRRKNATGSLETVRSGSVEIAYQYRVGEQVIEGSNYMRAPFFVSERDSEPFIAEHPVGSSLDICTFESYPSLSWVKGDQISTMAIMTELIIFLIGCLLGIAALVGVPKWLKEEFGASS